MKKLNTKEITVVGILLALMIVLAATPLGFIPIGPINATTIHIPVIIAAVLYGRKISLIMGLFFGLISFARAFLNPSIVSFILMDPFVSIIPRILMGYLTGLLFDLIRDKNDKIIKIIAGIISLLLSINIIRRIITSTDTINTVSLVVLLLFLVAGSYFILIKSESRAYKVYLTASVGSLLNTIFFLTAVYFLHAEEYIKAIGKSGSAIGVIMNIVYVNGIMEAIVSAIIVTGIYLRIKKS